MPCPHLQIGWRHVRSIELQKLVELKAYRNAYFAYGTGAFLVISAVIAAGLAHISVTPFLVVNLVLLFMVLAQFVKFGTQLLYYRKQS